MNKERTILYLFSINAIIYIASGFYTPFLSAYYAQKGIDAEKIGILLMIGPCVVLLTQRFWAKISDRTGKRKEVLLVTIVGSGFSMLLYYLGNSFLCMFFATVVVTSFTTAVIPLSDAILIARSLKEGYSYSIIRLGGTLGYAVMTICAGMYLKTRPQMQFVFAFFAYMILFCFCIGSPVYNFINDRLVDESAVLRPLSWHLILYVFRYFSRKWQKISDCECPDLIQNETPVRFLYGTQKNVRSDRAESSWHSN